jgi:hypothetical protein
MTGAGPELRSHVAVCAAQWQQHDFPACAQAPAQIPRNCCAEPCLACCAAVLMLTQNADNTSKPAGDGVLGLPSVFVDVIAHTK